VVHGAIEWEGAMADEATVVCGPICSLAMGWVGSGAWCY
jgi:hypothetical protein